MLVVRKHVLEANTYTYSNQVLDKRIVEHG